MTPFPEARQRWDPLSEPPPIEGPVQVESAVDLFSAEVDVARLGAMIDVIEAAPELDFVLLTSRAKRLLMLGNEGLRFPPNLWVGVAVAADTDVWRVEDLLRCNTAKSWVLIEGGPLPSLPVGMLSAVVCAAAPDEGWVPDLAVDCERAGVTFQLGAYRPGGT